MSNRPEWMLSHFRQKIEDIMAEYPHQDDAVEELAVLLTRYALMPPEAAKTQVREEDDE